MMIIMMMMMKQKSLCVTNHHAMETYCRSEGTAPHILTLGTTLKLVTSFTIPVLYRVRAPGTHWVWMDPRACLNTMTKRKVPVRARNRTQVVQPSDIMHFLHTPYSLCAMG
jgi:hypothetical protein